MVALLYVICILGLLFSLTCVIKARKLERRALVLIDKLQHRRQLEKRFRGRHKT